ncbi:MAG TPA: hypothetical protein VN436_03135 [Holophaga sp.]|nr:hypothetical protein [Holophaga sp.]
MARLTLPAIALVLEGTEFKVGVGARRKGRLYWLEGPGGPVPGTEAGTLETILGAIHAQGIA